MSHGPCRFVWDAPRPFVHPLRAPDGSELSADAPADHPWHHGLWFAIKFVNGDNFWEEYGEFGTLRTTAVSSSPTSEQARIDWVRPDGRAVALHETRTVERHDLGGGAYALDWTMALTPTADTRLDRTPFTTWGGYGGLTLRGAPHWTDTAFTIAGGDRARERLLGERAAWCDLTGTTALGAIAGVAMLDHPGNHRFPNPWYGSTRAETYGAGWANFFNAAFLWDAPLDLAGGATMVRRHRVLVHDGWSRERIDEHAGAYRAG